MPLERVTASRQLVGGITLGNCALLVAAGADFLAVSGAVLNDEEAAPVRSFHEAIAEAR